MCTPLFDLLFLKFEKSVQMGLAFNSYVPIWRPDKQTNVLLKNWNHLSEYWDQLIIIESQKWKAIIFEAFSRMQIPGCHCITEFVAVLFVPPEHKVRPANSVVLQFKIQQKILYLHSQQWQFKIHKGKKKIYCYMYLQIHIFV